MGRVLDLSGLHGSLTFHAQRSDYNNCIDISSEGLVIDEDGFDLVRHFLARIDKRDLPELIEVLQKLDDSESIKEDNEVI